MRVQHLRGDIFQMASNGNMAQCLSADLKMVRGIAPKFRHYFPVLATIPAGTAKVGQTVRVRTPNQYIFNLITKEKYHDKPTYKTMEDALKDLRGQMLILRQKSVYIPRIGCGLDHLEWHKVERLIEDVFVNTDIDIFVCTPTPRSRMT